MSDCDTTNHEGLDPDLVATGPATVFVVDDHAGYRAVAAAVVEATPGFVLVGSSASADDAVASILALDPPPDLILMDINLGSRSGVEVTETLIRSNPTLSIVFVSALGEDELPPRAQSCGATGFIQKLMLSCTVLEDARSGAYDWRR